MTLTRARTALNQVMLIALSLLALAISSNVGQGHLLSVAHADAWRSIEPTGTAPSRRRQYGLIVDQANDRIVVAGGEFSDGKTWALNLAGPPVWTLLNENVPWDANNVVRAIYDSAGQKMILVTFNLSGPVMNVYALDLNNPTAWTAITPAVAGPVPRPYPAVAYDSLRNRLILFGGGPNTGVFSDVWALNLSGGTPTWQQLSPQGPAPSPRWGSTAIYDQAHDQLVIATGSGAGGMNDVWALSLADPSAWTQIEPQGPLPHPRYLSAAAYDPVTGSLLLFGGYAGSGFNDTWELDLSHPSHWTLLQPTGSVPPPRWSHVVAYRNTVPELVTYGGWDGSFRTDTWALSRPSLGGAPIIDSFSPPGGPIGDPVQIFGIRLSPPSQVTIGGAVASILSSSPTSITAVVPPGAVTGPISVATSLGNATSTSRYFVGDFADCPKTSYSVMNGPTVLDPAPTGSASAWGEIGNGASVSWNAPLGTISASAQGWGHHYGGTGGLTLSDEFEIFGPPPGTVVTLTVRLVATGQRFFDFGYGCSFGAGLSDSHGRAGTAIESTDSRQVIELPLTLAVRAREVLSFSLGASANGGFHENASASYSFPDLPPGIGVRSCRGFRAAGPPSLSCPQALTVEGTGTGSAAADPRIQAWLASARADGGCNNHPMVTNDAPVEIGLGVHPITFTARDSCGKQSQCVATLTVVDRTPPKLAVTARPGRLWPPDHAMRSVAVSIEVSDICDPAPRVSLEGVDIEDSGAGRSAPHLGPDVQGAQAGGLDTLVSLRAERAGGERRRYLLRYKASDRSGNSVIDTAEVVVDEPAREIAMGTSVDGAEHAAITEWSRDGTLTLATPEFVDYSVFGVDGRRLRQVLLGQQPAGRRPLIWDTRNEAGRLVPSGIYYLRVVAGRYRWTRRVVVVR